MYNKVLPAVDSDGVDSQKFFGYLYVLQFWYF